MNAWMVGNEKTMFKQFDRDSDLDIIIGKLIVG